MKNWLNLDSKIMNKWFHNLFILAFTLIFVIPVNAQTMVRRPKVAVVLSGGGAKGMAHIGVLKVIERAGIPIDIITGTSMGSLIGGLYSVGYNAETLDSLVHVQDWTFLLSDKANMRYQTLSGRKKQNTYFLTHELNFKKLNLTSGGLIQGKNLAALFAKFTEGYRDSMDFNKLPIPFACVATNIVDNSEHDFHSGYLYQAMRSSMSIPGVFSPVRIGNEVLVDGGLKNNFPVDIARQMGADYVIGITVQGAPKTADELSAGSSVIGQIVDINCKNKYDANIADTDVPIRVNTKGYSTASFSQTAIDTLISRGEQEAMKHWDELLELKKKIGLSTDYIPENVEHLHGKIYLPTKIKINKFDFIGTEEYDNIYISHLFHISSMLNDSVLVSKIDRIVSSLQIDLYYNDAHAYYNENRDGSYDVNIVVDEKQKSRVSLAARFDNEEMAALQVNGSILAKTKGAPLDLEATLRLGKRIMGKADLSFSWMSWKKITLSYIFRHNEFNVYEHGDRAFNTTYNYHGINLRFLDYNIQNFNINIGPKFEYYRFNDVLTSEESAFPYLKQLSSLHIWSYHAELNYNSENDWNFPTRGSCFFSSYDYNTDDLLHYKSKKGISIASGLFRTSFPICTKFTIQAMAYGRFIFGSEIPVIKLNFIGGNSFDHYIDGQMPMAGIGYAELTDRHFLALQVKSQYRLWENSYIIANVSAAEHDEQLSRIIKHSPMIGYQATYCYNTALIGPVSVTLGSSTKTHKLYFFINVGFYF